MNRLIAWAACAFCAAISIAAASFFVVNPAPASLALGVTYAAFALAFGITAAKLRR